MPAVSDSSPLILYAKIGRLDLVETVYNEVFVPPEVWSEVVHRGGGRPGAVAVASADWIHAAPLTDPALANSLAEQVGRGEAEAIALALQMPHGTAILLDDQKGRTVARLRGLQVIGSGGLLVIAKQSGLIEAVRPLLSDLRTAGLYLSDGTMRELLSMVSESPTEVESR
jgi:predicted nucleic acid-binding protein